MRHLPASAITISTYTDANGVRVYFAMDKSGSMLCAARPDLAVALGVHRHWCGAHSASEIPCWDGDAGEMTTLAAFEAKQLATA